MRLPTKTLSLFFLALLLSASLFFAPQSHAASSVFFPGLNGVEAKSENELLKEFCDKRSGDLMNLETWYSGKCGDGVDTLSGEGVGFSDIVLLQGLEYIKGPQTTDFITSIIRKLNIIKEVKESLSEGKPLPSQTEMATLNGGGLLGSLGGLTAKLATVRPASSLDYLAYVSTNLKNHHIINQAFASGPGYGFTALSPILPLWRAFRNIAYLLFALAFVLYGVMIMFRVKIDAKTAASIQLAVPKLIATLLLITFSYAIVGFLIDISTVISAMIIGVLKAGGILTDINNIVPMIASGQSLLGAVGSALVNGFLAVIVSPFIFFNLLIGGLLGMSVAFVAAIAGTLTGIGLLIGIIIIIAVVFSYTKLIFKLFQAFLSIIVNLIFAPIILLGNLFPGSTSFGDWLRSIYGNLAVFPVAIFFLTLSYALLCQPILTLIPDIVGHYTPIGWVAGAVGLDMSFITKDTLENILGVKSLADNGIIWTPPLTIPGAGSTWTKGGQQTGTAAGSEGSLMLATIGFGLLMMSSKYCEMVEKALKTPPFPYGAAIGEALKYGSKGNNWLAMQNYGGLKAPTGKPLSDWYKPAVGATKPTVGGMAGGYTLPE
jgi:hypothetical protein